MSTLGPIENWTDVELVERLNQAFKFPVNSDVAEQRKSFGQAVVDELRAEIARRGLSIGCPKCKSRTVSAVSGGHRCNQCGHQYTSDESGVLTVPKVEAKPPKPTPIKDLNKPYGGPEPAIQENDN